MSEQPAKIEQDMPRRWFGRRFLDWLFSRWIPDDTPTEPTWEQDIHLAYIDQNPIRTRALVYAFVIVLAALIVWAAFAEVEEITRGEGRVIPSRQLQVVQSLDGGIVKDILVREGDIVNPGQLLIRLDNTRSMATYRESVVEQEALEARAVRLQALAEGTDFDPPAKLLETVPEIVARERELFQSKRAEKAAQMGIVRQQLEQREQELVEQRALRRQLQKSYNLTSQELNLMRPLVDSGSVSKVELLRLDRDLTRFRGEREQTDAQIARSLAAIAEAKQKIEQVKLDLVNQSREELGEVLARIKAMSEGEAGLSDRVTQTDVKSPVRGTVKTVLYNTVGGVVLPGKELVEIVPLDDALLLEARISPKDIAFLSPGQKAVVKFTAYDFVVYGGLEGRIEQIAADTVMDDNGNPFYLVRVRTEKASLGEDKPVIPGMVATVDILTGKKTVLTYLLKPVLRGKYYALSER